MYRSLILIGIVPLLIAVNLTADDERAKVLKGKVLFVVDGDTFAVIADETRDQFNVRLLGVDAPEKRQLYGSPATHRLRELIQERPVRIEYSKFDRNGRTILGDVYVMGNKGTDEWVNLVMLKEGLGWHVKDVDKRKSLADAEAKARKAKLGLWAQPDPVPPWEWIKPAKRPSSE